MSFSYLATKTKKLPRLFVFFAAFKTAKINFEEYSNTNAITNMFTTCNWSTIEL